MRSQAPGVGKEIPQEAQKLPLLWCETAVLRVQSPGHYLLPATVLCQSVSTSVPVLVQYRYAVRNGMQCTASFFIRWYVRLMGKCVSRNHKFYLALSLQG